MAGIKKACGGGGGRGRLQDLCPRGQGSWGTGTAVQRSAGAPLNPSTHLARASRSLWPKFYPAQPHRAVVCGHLWVGWAPE